MWKHTLHEHKNEVENVSFDMKINAVFNKSLRRQIYEGVAINNKRRDENLN